MLKLKQALYYFSAAYHLQYHVRNVGCTGGSEKGGVTNWCHITNYTTELTLQERAAQMEEGERMQAASIQEKWKEKDEGKELKDA